jgi:hypothetical protein
MGLFEQNPLLMVPEIVLVVAAGPLPDPPRCPYPACLPALSDP